MIIFKIIIIGLAISSLLYWIGLLVGRMTIERHFIKWWLSIATIQGIIIAAALKLMKLI